jgi:hypothetical protein
MDKEVLEMGKESGHDLPRDLHTIHVTRCFEEML